MSEPTNIYSKQYIAGLVLRNRVAQQSFNATFGKLADNLPGLSANGLQALQYENARLREALQGLLDCPAISDGNLSCDQWGCPDSLAAEVAARAALAAESEEGESGERYSE